MPIIKDYIRFLFKSRNFIVVLLWACYLISYLRGLLLKIPVVSDYIEPIITLFIGIPILISLPYYIKQPVLLKCFYIYFSFCLLYLLNDVFYPENSAVLDKNLTRCLFTSFPFILYGCLIDIRKYFNAFYLTSIVCIACDAFYFLFFSSSGIDLSGDEMDHNMVAAYALLPHVLLCIVAVFRGFKLWKVLVALAGCIMLLSYGARGPVACLIVFTVASLVLLRGTLNIKGLIGLSVFSVSLIVFFNQIITFLLYVIGDVMGMSTRVLDRFINNSIAEDDIRASIIMTLLERLKTENRLFGFGILGSYNVTGGYPHNFFVDILFSFGYVVGGLMLAVLGYCIIRAFRISGAEERAFLLVLLCSGFMHLLFSGTFVYDADFYLFLGFLIRLLNRSKPYEQQESLCGYRI